MAAVAAHNAIVRRLAAERPGTLLVDQAQESPRAGRYFNDACHQTVLGSTVFAENLVKGLVAKPE